MIEDAVMEFLIVRESAHGLLNVGRAQSVREAFEFAGVCAEELHSAGAIEDVIAIVRLTDMLVVCRCQVQVDVGLHYWTEDPSARQPRSSGLPDISECS